MYHLHVMGQGVTSLATAVGAIKHLSPQCTLVYEESELDAASDTKGYTGPLLMAPPGWYPLWHCRPGEPLMITPKEIVLGASLILTRFDASRLEDYLDEDVRRSFHKLLARSEKHLHVYRDITGHREYRLLWEREPNTEVMVAVPGYTWQGVVTDLNTGEIRGNP